MKEPTQNYKDFILLSALIFKNNPGGKYMLSITGVLEGLSYSEMWLCDTFKEAHERAGRIENKEMVSW